MVVFTAATAIFTAVSTWIGGLSALGAFALKAAVGLGLSLAAQALAGKPKQQEQTFSLSTSLQGGGAIPRSIIVGRAATGGSLVWANTWGNEGKSPNAWLTMVIALSDYPVRGLAEVWVDGQRVDWNPARNNETVYGQPIDEFNKDGPNMYLKFYDGNQTTFDASLVGIDSNSERTWNIDRIGYGVSYAIVRYRATKNQFSGIPKVVFVVDGARLYDPSKDTSVGGDGPQRLANPATWGGDGDDLPAVQLYNVMIGFYRGGQWIYGFQRMSQRRLDTTWITAINKCRSLVQSSTGFEPQYRSGGEIVVSAPISEAIDTLLTACQGEIAEAGGFYSLRVGEPEAPLFTITDNDIISTDEQRFTPFYGLADSINGITGTYPEPAENWLEKAAPPLYRPDLEALDGNRRLLADVQFTFVPYAEQVQRLMKSALLSAMRTRRHTLTLPPKFWRYCVPGDTLRWTSERNGYVNKLFVIKGVVDRDSLECVIDVLEWDPSDYSWNSSSEFQPPVIGSLGPIIPAPQPILDWDALPYIIRDQQSGARRPAIRLIWDNDPEALIGVLGVEWEVRVQGQTDLVTAGNTTQPERGSAIISSGILPNTGYEARGRFIPLDGNRDTLWSEFIPVITDNILLGEGDIEVELAVVGDSAKAVWKNLGAQLDNISERLELLAQAEQLEGAVSQIARQKLSVELGESRAEIERIDRVIVTEVSALASTVTTLDARVGDNEASIIEESTARVDQDEALAEQINALRVEFDENFAEGLVKFEAVASPSGVLARFSVLVRAALNQEYLSSGFFLEVYSEGGQLKSRMVVSAQQFLVAADTVSRPVFAVIGEQVYIVNARIQQAQIDNLLVGTSNIAPSAVTAFAENRVGSVGGGISTPTLTVNHGTGSPTIKLEFKALFQLATGATGSSVIIGNVTDGNVLENGAIFGSGPFFTSLLFTPPAGRSSTTFQMTINISGNSSASNVYLLATVFKR